MKRRSKQITVVVIVLIISGMVVGGIKWLTYTRPNCNDNIQNGQEEGVDCGGVCGKVCPDQKPKAKKLSATNVQVVKANSVCDIVASVENTNVSLGGKDIPYTIQWGEVKKQGSFYIFPSETRYIIEINQPCQEGKKLEFNIGEPEEWEFFRGYEKPKLDITNKNFRYLENNYEFAEVTGVVVNNSNFDLQEIEVYAILKNSKGSVMGVNKTTVNSILIGERREFRLFWTSPLPGKVSSIDIFTTTNLFNSHNFMQKHGFTSSLEGDIE